MTVALILITSVTLAIIFRPKKKSEPTNYIPTPWYAYTPCKRCGILVHWDLYNENPHGVNWGSFVDAWGSYACSDGYFHRGE